MRRIEQACALTRSHDDEDESYFRVCKRRFGVQNWQHQQQQQQQDCSIAIPSTGFSWIWCCRIEFNNAVISSHLAHDDRSYFTIFYYNFDRKRWAALIMIFPSIDTNMFFVLSLIAFGLAVNNRRQKMEMLGHWLGSIRCHWDWVTSTSSCPAVDNFVCNWIHGIFCNWVLIAFSSSLSHSLYLQRTTFAAIHNFACLCVMLLYLHCNIAISFVQKQLVLQF